MNYNCCKRLNEDLTLQAASNIAKRRIVDLSVETINSVQSRTVFTVEEEELLSAIPSTTAGSDLAVFEQVRLISNGLLHFLITP